MTCQIDPGRRATAAVALLLLVASIHGDAREATQRGGVVTLRHAGRDRVYHLDEPPAARSRARPLLVVLHGGGAGGSADHVASIREASRFDAKAAQEGFVVVYPEAIDGYWNDGRGLRRYRAQADNVDDVGFIAAVVDHVSARLSVDRTRVFVAGASNGAMMAYRMACERPQGLAGVAAVVGNLPSRLACQPPGRVPVLIVNGTEDPLMPWDGGQVRFGLQRLGEVLSAGDTASRWAAINGCRPAPVEEALPDRAPGDGTRVRVLRFTSCRAAVSLYRVEGGGHTWPGGPQLTAAAIVGRTSRDIDATDVIWDFFSRPAGEGNR